MHPLRVPAVRLPQFQAPAQMSALERRVATANTDKTWVAGGLNGGGAVLHRYFFRVSHLLARGCLVDEQGLADLKRQGFKSVVNLRAENEFDDLHAPKLGLNVFHARIDDNSPPTIEQLRPMLDFLRKPENQPAYLHCWGGTGRTGVAIACARMALEGMSLPDALAEAKAFGLRLDSQLDAIRRFGQALERHDPRLAGYPIDLRPPAKSPWKPGTPVREYEYQVSPDLWRGSRVPDERRADYLASLGIKAVANLREEDNSEAPNVAAAGMEPLHLEVEEYRLPNVAQVLRFLNFVTDPKTPKPVYVHCNRGINRTGLFVACYRMAVQGWSVERATEEAKRFGMNIPEELGFIRDFGRSLQAGVFEGYPKRAIAQA